ncbi:MAG: DUF502 domain-containing protein [Phycisphaerales bacterium]|nr:MAG: DUF502 domain-containing protein [Phycisphaerales bacterium]
MALTRRFKSYFLRGLAVLLPTIVTIWIFVWAYMFIQGTISIHINRGLVQLIMLVQGEDGIDEEGLTDIFVKGKAGSLVGFLIALVAVLIVGALLASVVGRALWRMIEMFIMSTPLLRRVYPYVKQITDFVLTQEEKTAMFSKVVAVEYPRKGIWSIGLVTGSGLKKVSDNVEKEFLTVLIPNSPTPITGYVVMVPKEQTIALDMTVEEAFRFAVSAGVITPDSQRLPVLPEGHAKNEQEQERSMLQDS